MMDESGMAADADSAVRGALCAVRRARNVRSLARI
jgi:hypothetical protein